MLEATPESDTSHLNIREGGTQATAAELLHPPFPDARRRWMPLAGTVAFGFLADLSVRPLMELFNQEDWGAVWVYVCFGIIAAQGALFSAWLVWAQGRFLFRLALHWCAVFVALIFWAIGLVLSTSFDFRRLPQFQEREVWVTLWVLPVIALMIQLPLWITRQYLGWRLSKSDDPRASEPDTPLKIRDLMVATVVVGFSLMGGRIATTGVPAEGVWIGLGIASVVAVGISAITVLPVGSCLLRQPNWRLGLVLVVAECIVGTMVVIILFAWLARFPLTLSAWHLAGFAITILSHFATLAVTALAARTAGLSLYAGRLISSNHR